MSDSLDTPYTLETLYLANVQPKGTLANNVYEIFFPLVNLRITSNDKTIAGPKLESPTAPTLPTGIGSLRSNNYLNQQVRVLGTNLRRVSGSMQPFYGYANRTEPMLVVTFQSDNFTPSGPWNGTSLTVS